MIKVQHTNNSRRHLYNDLYGRKDFYEKTHNLTPLGLYTDDFNHSYWDQSPTNGPTRISIIILGHAQKTTNGTPTSLVELKDRLCK